MSSPDLKIVDPDVRGGIDNLKRIADDFGANAQVAADVGGALGHQALAKKLGDFSESWRVNRERMAKDFESLSKELQQKLDAFTEVDQGIGGGGKGTEGHIDPSGATTTTTESGRGGDRPGPGGGSDPNSTLPSGGGVASPGHAPTTLPPSTPGEKHSEVSPSLLGGPGRPPIEEPAKVPTDDLTVDLSGGDFHAVAPIVAGGGAATTAILMGLYQAWLRSKQGASTTNPDTPKEEVDARTKLLVELERMKFGDGKGTVELVADDQNPGDVLAILRGEDGSESTINFGELGGESGQPGGGDPGTTPEPGREGEIVMEDPAVLPPEAQPTEAPADGAATDPDLAAGGASPDPSGGAGGGGGSALGSDLPEEPSAASATGGSSHAASGAAAHASTLSGGGLPTVAGESLDGGADEVTAGHAAAGSSATMGMMGMGMGMAGAASSATAATPRARTEEERRLSARPTDKEGDSK